MDQIIELHPMDLSMGHLAIVSRIEFGHNSSLKSQFEFCMTTTKYTEELQVDGYPAFHMVETFKNQVKRYDIFAREYFDIGRKLGFFLRRDDISLLVLLIILLKNSSRKEGQNLVRSSFGTLMKRIEECREFDSVGTPQEVVALIFDNLQNFGKLMATFLSEGQTEPELQKIDNYEESDSDMMPIDYSISDGTNSDNSNSAI